MIRTGEIASNTRQPWTRHTLVRRGSSRPHALSCARTSCLLATPSNSWIHSSPPLLARPWWGPKFRSLQTSPTESELAVLALPRRRHGFDLSGLLARIVLFRACVDLVPLSTRRRWQWRKKQQSAGLEMDIISPHVAKEQRCETQRDPVSRVAWTDVFYRRHGIASRTGGGLRNPGFAPRLAQLLPIQVQPAAIKGVFEASKGPLQRPIVHISASRRRRLVGSERIQLREL